MNKTTAISLLLLSCSFFIQCTTTSDSDQIDELENRITDLNEQIDSLKAELIWKARRKHTSRIRKFLRLDIHTWKILGAAVSSGGSILYYRKCTFCGTEGTGCVFKGTSEQILRAKLYPKGDL